MEFRYTTEDKEDYIVFAITGSLMEKSQARVFLDEVEELLLRDVNRFVVDMSGITYLNSSGLNVLINLLAKARRSGGEVVICSVPQKIKELLLITKLNTVFIVTESVDEGVEKIMMQD
jgi:anti-sigma B factor antagonist